MFSMQAKVIVEFADIANFAFKRNEMPRESIHRLMFRSYDAPFSEGCFVVERAFIESDRFLPEELKETIIAFMDEYELEEFFWVA